MAQGQQGFYGVEQGIRIGFLIFHGGRVGGFINWEIEAVFIRIGEARIFSAVSLHRCAGTGSEVAAFLCRQL